MKVAVLGAGHAGRGLAAYFSLKGLDVSLYNRTLSNVQGIIENGGLDVGGVVEGYAAIKVVTDDMQEALRGRNLIVVSVPAQAHHFFAEKMAPHLKPRQLVLLMPGRTCGAPQFIKLVEEQSGIRNFTLGETQTFSFISRMDGAHSVLIARIKNLVRASALPASSNKEFFEQIRKLPLSFKLAENVLATGFNNVGAMLHPAPTILCAGLLESQGGRYNHYHDAISKTVGRFIERIDSERVRVASKYDAQPMTLMEWLKETYDATGATLWDAIRSVDTYKGIGSPPDLQHRYVLEDVPTGLVPMSHLGKLADVKTPGIDAVINMACQLYERDFWREGRSLSRMGFSGMSTREIIDYVQSGNKILNHSSYLDNQSTYSAKEADEK